MSASLIKSTNKNPMELKSPFTEKPAEIRFPGPEFIDDMRFDPDQHKRGVTQIYKRNVFCYHDIEKLRSEFNLPKNGFQFEKLDFTLEEKLQRYALDPSNQKSSQAVALSATNYIEQWAKKNDMSFAGVACLGLVYRTTNQPQEGAAKPINFVHVDFQGSDLSNVLQIPYFENVWKPHIEKTMGISRLTTDQYRNLKITQIVNLWMPLNKLPTQNGIVVMDTMTFDPSKDLRQFKNIDGDNRFTFNSQTVDSHSKQKLVTQERMILGDCVIFNSFLTPHCSANLDRGLNIEYDQHRVSVEARFAFLEELPTN